MAGRRLQDWEREAVVLAYAAGEKIDALCVEFGISRRYPGTLAKRRGLTARPAGRPKRAQRAVLVLVTN